VASIDNGRKNSMMPAGFLLAIAASIIGKIPPSQLENSFSEPLPFIGTEKKNIRQLEKRVWNS